MVDENAMPDYQPRKPGGSNTLVWVLAIGAGVLVICCGGLGVMAWKAKSFVANLASSDPVEIRRQTAEMLEITIPDTFKPMQAMNMVAVRMVMYQTGAAPGSPGMLMLMEMAIPGAGNAQQQEQQLRQSMRQQQSNQNFQASKSETREIEIRGEKVPFEFSEGTNSQGKAMHMVGGVVRGKRGPVMLQLIIPAEEYDEEAVLQMLQSIK
jgi:hypothetical protein